jgi:hypothetical protein
VALSPANHPMGESVWAVAVRELARNNLPDRPCRRRQTPLAPLPLDNSFWAIEHWNFMLHRHQRRSIRIVSAACWVIELVVFR